MGKYLDFYKKCMETGEMPRHNRDGNYGGLCGVIGPDAMNLFVPGFDDCKEYDVVYYGYYASDNRRGTYFQRALEFGPTRQNMVLLLAAIHDEDFNELKR